MKESTTQPWSPYEFYKVDGIPMMYETLTVGVLRQDIIIDYEGRKWTVEQLEAQGYRIDKPAVHRVYLGVAA